MDWNFVYEHCLLRMGYPISPDTIMAEVVDFYQKSNRREYIAKASYVQGAGYYLQSDYDNAMTSFKIAEENLPFVNDTITYAAMTYYFQGLVAETDLLDNVAFDSYQKALPLFIEAQDTRRIAHCYRDLARTSHIVDESLTDIYFSKAIEYASETKDTVLLYEILLQEECYKENSDTMLFSQLGNELIEKYNNYRYSGIIAEYMIDHNRFEEAEYYLKLFEQDGNSRWNKEEYQYLCSRLNAQKGLFKSAYKQIHDVYIALYSELIDNAKIRTAVISKAYDVEREQNKNLQLIVRQQHLWITIGAISGCTILLLLLGVLLYNREHQQRILKEQAQELEHLRAEKAENDLEAKREALRKLLRQRIQLTKQIRQSVDGLSNIPQKTQQLIGQLSFNDQVSWAEFISEFDDLYGNILSEMKKTYPSITEQDEQYIALSLLGLSNNEIAFLLQINPQSVWNRRQRLRNHMGNSITDLDNWLSTWQKTIR